MGRRNFLFAKANGIYSLLLVILSIFTASFATNAHAQTTSELSISDPYDGEIKTGAFIMLGSVNSAYSVKIYVDDTYAGDAVSLMGGGGGSCGTPGIPTGPCSGGGSSSGTDMWTFDVPELSNGNHHVTAKSFDSFGTEIDTVTINFVVQIPGARFEITSVSPDNDNVAGGSEISINGSGFTGATSVKFGGIEALSFNIISDELIKAYAPVHAVGSAPIVITKATGSTDPFVFTYYVPTPYVFNMFPRTDTTAGGREISITGTGLYAVDKVIFGTTEVSTFVSKSDDTIIVAAPPHTEGEVQVTVHNATATSATNNNTKFTYTAPITPTPVITSLGTNSGPTEGGTIVVINGTDFTGATAVKFGTQNAASFIVDSNTKITAISQTASAGSVNVTVVTPGGTSNGVAYTYVAPVIFEISTATLSNGNKNVAYSASLQTTGGTGNVTFSLAEGSSLPTGLTLSTAGVISGTPTTIGSTTFTITARDSASPTAHTASKAFTLTVTKTPKVESIAATRSYTSDGIVFELTGTDLDGATSVTIDGVNAPLDGSTSNPQSLNVIIPPSIASGSHDFVVTTSAGTGNSTVNYTKPVPYIYNITPNGRSFTFLGNSFAPNPVVKFGTRVVEIVSANSEVINVTVPNDLAAGNYDVTVTTPYGTSNSQAVIVTASLSISTASLADATRGVAYSATLASDGATGSVTYSLAEGSSLPAGLSLSAAGDISGTPTSGGAFTFTIIATDSSSPTAHTATKLFTLNIAKTPIIQSAEMDGYFTPEGFKMILNGYNLEGAMSVIIDNGVSARFYSDGSQNNDTRIIIIVPTNIESGLKSFTVLTSGGVGSAYFRFAKPVPTVSSAVVIGNQIRFRGTFFGFSPEVKLGTRVFRVDTVGVGEILVDIPQDIEAGTYTATITTQYGSTQFNGVEIAPLKITTTTLATGFQGVVYNQALATSGGIGASHYTISSGDLPAGLSLSDAGVISGTPTQAGEYSFTVDVADSLTPTAKTASKTFDLTISLPPTPAISSISLNSYPKSGGGTLTINGTNFNGASGVKFGSIDASAFTIISATKITATVPESANAGTVNVVVQSAGGASNGIAFTYTNPTIAFVTPQTLPDAKAGENYQQTISVINGVGSVTFGFDPNNEDNRPPANITLGSDGALRGIPTTAGVYNFTVSATDSANPYPQSVTRTFTLNVAKGDAPSITSLDAGQNGLSGSTAGGASLAIKGNGFIGTTQVKFGDVAATSFNVVDDNNITATAPAHAAGNVNINVTNAYGTATSNETFIFVAPSGVRTADTTILIEPMFSPPGENMSFVNSLTEGYGDIPMGQSMRIFGKANSIGKVYINFYSVRNNTNITCEASTDSNGNWSCDNITLDSRFDSNNIVHAQYVFSPDDRTILPYERIMFPYIKSFTTDTKISVIGITKEGEGSDITLSLNSSKTSISPVKYEFLEISKPNGNEYIRIDEYAGKTLPYTIRGLADGDYSARLIAFNSHGIAGTSSVDFSITSNFHIVTTQVQNFLQYSLSYGQLNSTNSTGNVTYALAPGSSLPDGLSLNSNGVIDGIPYVYGDFDFDIIATDSSSPTPRTTRKTIRLVVERARNQDVTAPIFTDFPTDISITIPSNQSSATATWTEPTASDNNDVKSITRVSAIPNGGTFPVGTNVVTYEAIDHNGNKTSRSFNVVVTKLRAASVTLNFSLASGVTAPTLVLTSSGLGEGKELNIQFVPNGSYTASFDLPASGDTNVTFSVKLKDTSSASISNGCNSSGSRGSSLSFPVMYSSSSLSYSCNVSIYQNQTSVISIQTTFVIGISSSVTDKISNVFSTSFGSGGGGFGGGFSSSFGNSGSSNSLADIRPTQQGSISFNGPYGLAYRHNAPFNLDMSQNGVRFSYNRRMSEEYRRNAEMLRQNRELQNRPRLTRLSADDPAPDNGPILNANGEAVTNKTLRWNYWITGTGNYFRVNGGKGTIGIVNTGIDYQFNNRFILGLAMNGDWSRSRFHSDGTTYQTAGYLAGPYVRARIGGNLDVSATAFFGNMDNNVRNQRGFTNIFNSERQYYSASVSGNIDFKGVTISPVASVSYIRQNSESYKDTETGYAIPKTEVTQGQASFGPQINWGVKTGNDTTITNNFGISGVYVFDKQSRVVGALTPPNNFDTDLRARINAGTTISDGKGRSTSLSVYYDGVGQDANYNLWGVSITYRRGF